MKPVLKPIIIQNPGALRSTVLDSHLPSLDGMRAISILLVLIAHGAGSFGHPNAYCGYLGDLGVSIFFVISGLLITWLMIRERDATGAFSLPNFYIRRFLRILPVFWLLILIVSALKSAQMISISWLDILRAFTFTHNYPLSLHYPQIDYAWWLHHTWSLSLEEQFYLIWPSLFAFMPRRLVPRLAVVLALSGPVLRILDYYLLPSLRGYEPGAFQIRIDILMAGCASAFLLESPVWRQRIERIRVWPVLAATSSFLLLAEPVFDIHFTAHSLTRTVMRATVPTIQAAAIALTLLVLVAGKRGVMFTVVNLRAAQHLGKLSYSLYIWQQIFFLPSFGTIAVGAPWRWPALFRLPLIYLAAFCSFNFFERPFIKLRSKFRHGVAV
jgi:peptidoglycan/LPS O-acetylase OafA/YrhL